MNPSFQTRLGEILFELTVYDRMGTRSLEGIREEAQQQITDLVLEVVGEDERNLTCAICKGELPKSICSSGICLQLDGRNNLRAELRKAIEG